MRVEDSAVPFPQWGALRRGSSVPTSSNQPTPPIAEIDVLWITAGLGCDGDTIAMTAATQPSIEDIVMGGMPWIPKVNFHNPFLSFENGDGFPANMNGKPAVGGYFRERAGKCLLESNPVQPICSTGEQGIEHGIGK
jgi:hypothetical protein